MRWKQQITSRVWTTKDLLAEEDNQGMTAQKLVQIGSRILNLDAVRYIEVDSPNLVNVYLTEGTELQYIEAEAHALLAILAGYAKKIDVPDGKPTGY